MYMTALNCINSWKSAKNFQQAAAKRSKLRVNWQIAENKSHTEYRKQTTVMSHIN